MSLITDNDDAQRLIELADMSAADVNRLLTARAAEVRRFDTCRTAQDERSEAKMAECVVRIEQIDRHIATSLSGILKALGTSWDTVATVEARDR